MPLTLRFQSTGAIPGSGEPVMMRGASLTIGRGPENDLVLPDKDRMISKRHCVLEDHDSRVLLIDFSTNGTFVNYAKEPAGTGPTEVCDGDVLSLGAYELIVGIAEKPAEILPEHIDPIPPSNEPGPSSGGAPRMPDAMSPLEDGDGSGDFLDGLLGDSPTGGGARQLIPEDPLEASTPLIPDDDDILDSDRDEISEDPSPSQADHGAAMRDAFSAPSTTGAFIPDDWDLGDGEKTGVASMPGDPEGNSPSPEKASPTRDPHLLPTPDIAAEAANSAFLNAAGVDSRSIPAAELEATMARAGAVMLALISGLREVLMTRAAIKTEFRMKQTVVRAGDNNPLKFSVSVEQAMQAMLRPATKGYLDPVKAASEALKDVKAHEAAMLAGIEAALKGVLNRLDPKALEGKIEAGGALTGLLKGRKARYWEVYEKLYAEISDEVENDFHELFSKEFARAYQEQVEKL